MKSRARIYLVNAEGQTEGAFAWTLVREWIAFSLLPTDSLVLLEGEESWRTVAEFPDLQKLPKSFCDPHRTPGCFLSADRLKLQAIPAQHAYATRLGCPFNTDEIDRHLLNHIIATLSIQFPDRVDSVSAAEVEDLSDWHNDPATDRQIDYLRSVGIRVDAGLSKGRACQLIGGEATEGQLQRLRFYNISLTPYLTKEEASQLIDGYVFTHPESEEQYQTWKLKAKQA